MARFQLRARLGGGATGRPGAEQTPCSAANNNKDLSTANFSLSNEQTGTNRRLNVRTV
jgi:hypothetical protein